MAPGRKRGKNSSSAAATQEWSVGDLVLAKVKGYPAWPAQVSNPEEFGQTENSSRVFVVFFGTREIRFCHHSEISRFTPEARANLLAKVHHKCTPSDLRVAVSEICDVAERQRCGSDVAVPDMNGRSNVEEGEVDAGNSDVRNSEDGGDEAEYNGRLRGEAANGATSETEDGELWGSPGLSSNSLDPDGDAGDEANQTAKGIVIPEKVLTNFASHEKLDSFDAFDFYHDEAANSAPSQPGKKVAKTRTRAPAKPKKLVTIPEPVIPVNVRRRKRKQQVTVKASLLQQASKDDASDEEHEGPGKFMRKVTEAKRLRPSIVEPVPDAVAGPRAENPDASPITHDPDSNLPIVKRARARSTEAIFGSDKETENSTRSVSPALPSDAVEPGKVKDEVAADLKHKVSGLMVEGSLPPKAEKYRLRSSLADSEAALPPSKRLHRALEAMTACAAEAAEEQRPEDETSQPELQVSDLSENLANEVTKACIADDAEKTEVVDKSGSSKEYVDKEVDPVSVSTSVGGDGLRAEDQVAAAESNAQEKVTELSMAADNLPVRQEVLDTECNKASAQDSSKSTEDKPVEEETSKLPDVAVEVDMETKDDNHTVENKTQVEIGEFKVGEETNQQADEGSTEFSPVSMDLSDGNSEPEIKIKTGEPEGQKAEKQDVKFTTPRHMVRSSPLVKHSPFSPKVEEDSRLRSATSAQLESRQSLYKSRHITKASDSIILKVLGSSSRREAAKGLESVSSSVKGAAAVISSTGKASDAVSKWPSPSTTTRRIAEESMMQVMAQERMLSGGVNHDDKVRSQSGTPKSSRRSQSGTPKSSPFRYSPVSPTVQNSVRKSSREAGTTRSRLVQKPSPGSLKAVKAGTLSPNVKAAAHGVEKSSRLVKAKKPSPVGHNSRHGGDSSSHSGESLASESDLTSAKTRAHHVNGTIGEPFVQSTSRPDGEVNKVREAYEVAKQKLASKDVDSTKVHAKSMEFGESDTGNNFSRTEAENARNVFEGLLDILSRTKESISRATKQAMDCAKLGLSKEVIEIIARRLEAEPSYPRRIDLFFLVDSISQTSYSLKEINSPAIVYREIVQQNLPRLLCSAAPPGDFARENRRQCLKVFRTWHEKKIFPDTVTYHFMREIERNNYERLVSRRPPRNERPVDDPIREMEGMQVDEYGSNVSSSIPGFISRLFEEDEEATNDLGKTQINTSGNEPAVYAVNPDEPVGGRHHRVLEDVDGELEMEDVSPENETWQTQYVSPASTLNGPPLPVCPPPSPPPLPASPPPNTPPPPPPPPSPPAQDVAPPPYPVDGYSPRYQHHLQTSYNNRPVEPYDHYNNAPFYEDGYPMHHGYGSYGMPPGAPAHGYEMPPLSPQYGYEAPPYHHGEYHQESFYGPAPEAPWVEPSPRGRYAMQNAPEEYYNEERGPPPEYYHQNGPPPPYHYEGGYSSRRYPSPERSRHHHSRHGRQRQGRYTSHEYDGGGYSHHGYRHYEGGYQHEGSYGHQHQQEGGYGHHEGGYSHHEGGAFEGGGSGGFGQHEGGGFGHHEGNYEGGGYGHGREYTHDGRYSHSQAWMEA